jgi:hypothetical protein
MLRDQLACGLLPSVAQPPLPLQEFLPLQLLSPLLHPPWPLHSFFPLQECFPFSSSATVWSAVPVFVEVLAANVRTAIDPAKRPATAAPAMTTLGGLIICQFFVLIDPRIY